MPRLLVVWLWLCYCSNTGWSANKVCPTEGNVGNGTVWHINCSSSEPVVGYRVIDETRFAQVGVVTVEYTCTNASGNILADEIVASLSYATAFSSTVALGHSFEAGVQCTFSGCYQTGRLGGSPFNPTELLLHPTSCTVGWLPEMSSSEPLSIATATAEAPCVQCSPSHTANHPNMASGSPSTAAGVVNPTNTRRTMDISSSRTLHDVDTLKVSKTKGPSQDLSIPLTLATINLLPSTTQQRESKSIQHLPLSSAATTPLTCANCGGPIVVTVMWIGGAFFAVFVIAIVTGGLGTYAYKYRMLYLKNERRHGYFKTEWDEGLDPKFHPISTDFYPPSNSLDPTNWESIPSLFNSLEPFPSLIHSKTTEAGVPFNTGLTFDPSSAFDRVDNSTLQSESLHGNVQCNEEGKKARSLTSIPDQVHLCTCNKVSRLHDSTRISHDTPGKKSLPRVNAVNTLALNHQNDILFECTASSPQHLDRPVTAIHSSAPAQSEGTNKQTFTTSGTNSRLHRSHSVDILFSQSPNCKVHSYQKDFSEPTSPKPTRNKPHCHCPDSINVRSPQSNGYTYPSTIYTDESGAFLTDSEGYVCLHKQSLLS